MNVYEITQKVYLLRNISVEASLEVIAELLDKSLVSNQKFSSFHNENTFKNYCFNSFFPLEKDGIYKANNIYDIKIRTVDKNLADYFNKTLANEYTESIKGLVTNIRVIPKKHIEKIYNITPLVIKTDDGYWKNSLTFQNFERRIKENLIKKYNAINDVKIDEEFQLYNVIEVKNKKPIATSYKGKKILGDKVNLVIAEDSISQELAYMSLGTGISEMNSRGMGFVNYRWL
ncbi:MAG: CRISPR-associated endoribonuclease Cas6 [Clostridium sp.]|uniref:CRISPR-associated endoribonuclease Cas6 n=1 Tax=Clostridium sp. TaxID=1506 RepID=UPI00305292EE